MIRSPRHMPDHHAHHDPAPDGGYGEGAEIPGAYLKIHFIVSAVGVGIAEPVLFQIPGRAGVRKDRPVEPDAYAGREGYERRLVRDDRELLRGNDGKEGEDQDGDEAAQGKPAAGGKQFLAHRKTPFVPLYGAARKESLKGL